MKTISIQEAAEALGLTPGSVQLKLQKGELKGTRSKNIYGLPEWRVFLSQKNSASENRSELINFAAPDIIDPDDIANFVLEENQRASWRVEEDSRLEILADKLFKPLADRLESQSRIMQEQEMVIESQQQQLRLLPDLEKKAEEQRQFAEQQRRFAEEQRLYAEEQRLLAEQQRLSAEEHETEKELLKNKVEELLVLQNMKGQLISSLESELERVKQDLELKSRPLWKRLLGLSS